MFAILSVTTATLFGAISDPEPDVTPASEITWEDLNGGTTWASKYDEKDATHSYKNGTINLTGRSWQKGLTLNIGEKMTFNANAQWSGPTGASTDLHVIRIFNGGTFNVNNLWDPNWTHLQVDEVGTFKFNGTSFQSANDSWKQNWFDVYGLLDAPSGLKASNNLRMDIITHEESFGQLLANARVGSGMSMGKMVGVLTLDEATLKPIRTASFARLRRRTAL